MSRINLTVPNKNPEKSIYVDVYDESSWLKKPLLRLSTFGSQLSFDLVSGTYAILIIEDVFDDGIIVRDFWNVPINRIGVSICKEIIEPPTFKKCSFFLHEDVFFNLSIKLFKI